MSTEVEWWYRNPVRKPESAALYQWSSGVGFFPDFLVAVQGRKTGDGVADRDRKELRLFRLVAGELEDDGLFEVMRLRHD